MKITDDRGLYQACMLLGRFTRQSFDPWDLMGPANRRQRQDVMSALLGRRVPIAQAGVSAIQAELYRRAAIDGGCRAECDDNFRQLCREQIGDACAGYVQHLATL